MNGVNVVHERHGEVFSRITAIDGQVSLLVVDSATEEHFRQRDVIVDAQMTQVLRVTCPDVNPSAAITVADAITTDSGIETIRMYDDSDGQLNPLMSSCTCTKSRDTRAGIL